MCWTGLNAPSCPGTCPAHMVSLQEDSAQIQRGHNLAVVCDDQPIFSGKMVNILETVKRNG